MFALNFITYISILTTINERVSNKQQSQKDHHYSDASRSHFTIYVAQHEKIGLMYTKYILNIVSLFSSSLFKSQNKVVKF